MTSKVERRNPLSARFRQAAATVVDDAAAHHRRVTWIVARVDGGDYVVVTAAGGGRRVAAGDRLEPGPRDLAVPLELPNGAPLGVLCGLDAGPKGPSPVDPAGVQRLADLLAAVAGAEWEVGQQTTRADEATRRADQVEVEALTDALTGVSNRRAWDRALEAEDRRHRRYGGPAAVVVIDLDGFKEVNDTQGHLSGDLLLRLVARVIQDTSRESDVVARTGGDEFAVLALNCEEPQLEVLVTRLRKAFAAEGVPASIGGASRREDAGMAEAWSEADDLMFAEKSKRKG